MVYVLFICYYGLRWWTLLEVLVWCWVCGYGWGLGCLWCVYSVYLFINGYGLVVLLVVGSDW